MPKTDTGSTQVLEEVLKEGQTSDEKEEVSEDETKELEEPKDMEATKEPETAEAREKSIQAEVDKRANAYREKREADTALIRSLTSQVKELRGDAGGRKLAKAMEAVLAGDEEEGLEVDKIDARKKGFEEIKATIKDYNEQSAEVEEAAKLFSSVTENIASKKAIGGFGLDDPNPVVRVKNYANFINETISVYGYNQDFLMAVEDFLPKGDELRKQIEEITEGLSEFTDEKSKKLYLKDKLQGVKVTPRKKPLTPSDVAGGFDWSKAKPEEMINEGLRRDQHRK